MQIQIISDYPSKRAIADLFAVRMKEDYGILSSIYFFSPLH